MFRVELKGLEQVTGYLEALAKNQLPYATMLAVNDLAFEIRTAEIDTLKRTFPRAKPAVFRNVFVAKATKGNPIAKVRFDQLFNGHGIEEYMMANIEGGRRQMKPSEKLLGRFYVPGVGARRDKYGKMTGAQVTQILSRLGMFKEVGFFANASAKTKAKRERQARGGKKSAEYFMITDQRGGLKAGIYQRGNSSAIGSGRSGKGVVPVMVFSKKGAPSYQPRWPFFKEGQRIVDTRYQEVFAKRIADALRTAR